jgi:tRNA guanosine-2'-O-methyltransferase
MDMKRLRRKQSKFFEGYDADHACTVEGILELPVDEGSEAWPVHMVDIIKDCLKEVTAQGNAEDGPTWKQLETIMTTSESGTELTPTATDNDANFQRKIITIDALNLALEDMNDRRSRNMAGRRKQRLIVCASLVDKIPNLGGLARTAEIFAAERLVLPDLNVTKMDNFKTLSVTAGDWIQMEECKEKVRFSYRVCVSGGNYQRIIFYFNQDLFGAFIVP